MSSLHRAVAVCWRFTLLITLLLVIPGQAVSQLPPPRPTPPPPGGGPETPRMDPKDPHAFESIFLPSDRQDDAKKKIGAAIDNLTSANGSLEVACRSLQAILDGPGDVFIYIPRKGPDGKEVTVRVSARSEANRQLANLPPKALEVYQQLYGGPAKARVEDARRRRDPLVLDEVVRRYFYTIAGGDALVMLASYHLDRGQPGTAAFYFERLLQRPGSDKLEPLTLLKAAVAFHQFDDKTNEDLAWKLLAARQNNQPLAIGAQKMPLEQVRREVAKLANGSTVMHDWPLFRGDVRRTARGQGDAPFLEPRWTAATVTSPEVKTIIGNALKSNGESLAPTLSGSFPIAASGKLICRTDSGVAAFDLRTGEKKWTTELPLSLQSCFKESGKRVQMQYWLREYVREMGGGSGDFGGPPGTVPPGGMPLPPGAAPPTGLNLGGGSLIGSTPYVPSFVYENTVLGTLSTDHRRVYVVEDMPLLPPMSMLQLREQGTPRPLGPFEDLLNYNKLVALDLETGKKLWEIGGRPPRGTPQSKDDLFDGYFLGPPLPLHGKLYVVAEKQGEIRLVCLDPTRGEATWVQPLIVLNNNRLPMDSGRRLQAIQLAYADGILVCPTLGGAIVGVDVLGQSLAWVHIYRERPPVGPDGFVDDSTEQHLPMSPHWKASAPIIADGKVVIPCPDKELILCLNLRDGKQLWKTSRGEDDLYVAGVFGGKASGGRQPPEGQDEARLLIVGKTSCRAVSMTDGQTEVWRQATGMPSGHGVASGHLYYLPLQSGAIVALDVDKGTKGQPSEGRSGAPGNLLAHDGDIFSQSATALAAYPQLKFKLAQIDELIKRNPKDPLALTDRGELRLYQGDFTGAVADLGEARNHNPPPTVVPRLRTRLFDALSQMLQSDFKAGESYLDEYRELCKVDVPANATPEVRQQGLLEQQRRETQMLCLIAHGRENQPGRLAEALAAYRDLHAKAMGRMVTNLDDSRVQSRLDVWAETRIASLFAKAGAGRAELEQKVRDEWKQLRTAGGWQERDRFVALFGGTCRAGQEARLELADMMMTDLDRGRFLEAEQLLHQVRSQTEDRELNARAVEALARFLLRKGRLDEAATLYRGLGRDFADVVVRDGKTGAEWLADMAADRRLLGHLDDAGSPWLTGKFKGEHSPGANRLQPITFTFQPKGPVPAAIRRQALTFEAGSGMFKLTDRQTGQELWSQKAGVDASLLKFFRDGGVSMGMQPCHVQGRVAIVSLGTMIVGIDLLDRRVLWRKVLYDGYFDPQRFYLNVDGQHDGLQLYLYDRTGQGREQRLGRIACSGSTYVAMQTRQGLAVLDLLNGQTVWGRNDVASDVEIFGDDQYIMLVEGTGTTRALRVHDGAEVKVPAFLEQFQRKHHRLGRLLLLTEVDGEGRAVLRLYDVVTGKDVWKQTCAANPILVQSEDPGLMAVIEPDGKLRVFDLQQRREVLTTEVDRKHFDNTQAVRLMGTRTHFYLWTQNPTAPNAQIDGQAYSATMTMPTSLVNGWFYDLDKATGEARFVPVSNQHLLLEQLEDLPVILFAAALNKLKAGNIEPVIGVLSIDKQTFKRVCDPEIKNPNSFPGFYTLHVDLQALTIDLTGPVGRVRHSLEK